MGLVIFCVGLAVGAMAIVVLVLLAADEEEKGDKTER